MNGFRMLRGFALICSGGLADPKIIDSQAISKRSLFAVGGRKAWASSRSLSNSRKVRPSLLLSSTHNNPEFFDETNCLRSSHCRTFFIEVKSLVSHLPSYNYNVHSSQVFTVSSQSYITYITLKCYLCTYGWNQWRKKDYLHKISDSHPSALHS